MHAETGGCRQEVVGYPGSFSLGVGVLLPRLSFKPVRRRERDVLLGCNESHLCSVWLSYLSSHLSPLPTSHLSPLPFITIATRISRLYFYILIFWYFSYLTYCKFVNLLFYLVFYFYYSIVYFSCLLFYCYATSGTIISFRINKVVSYLILSYGDWMRLATRLKDVS